MFLLFRDYGRRANVITWQHHHWGISCSWAYTVPGIIYCCWILVEASARWCGCLSFLWPSVVLWGQKDHSLLPAPSAPDHTAATCVLVCTALSILLCTTGTRTYTRYSVLRTRIQQYEHLYLQRNWRCFVHSGISANRTTSLQIVWCSRKKS